MFGIFCRLALCAVGLAWLLAAQAQSQIATPLTLDEAVRRVTDHNPSLAAFAPRLKAMAGERSSAALKPPLELRAEADEFGGTNDAAGIDGIELTLALSSVIEFGDRPTSRIAIVDAREALIAAQRRTQLLDAQAEAARLYVELAALQQELITRWGGRSKI